MEQHHYVFHNNPTAVAGKVEMECRVEAYQFSKFTEQHHYVFHYNPTVVAEKVEWRQCAGWRRNHFSKFTEQNHYVFHYSPTVVAGKVEAEC